MPFFAEDIFVSDAYQNPVLDQTGEEIGKLKDITVGQGDPSPAVLSLVAVSGKHTFLITWEQVNLFNKRVISANVLKKDLQPAHSAPSDILIIRDLLDKQIVDINGAKLVRVNDLRLGDVNGKMCLVAVGIGFRGILRRLGLEARCYAAYCGEAEFARLAAEGPGSFYLADFLVRHFERLVVHGLGLDRRPEFLPHYFGHYRRVVYLSQSGSATLRERARAYAARLGLGFVERPTGLAALEHALGPLRRDATATLEEST